MRTYELMLILPAEADDKVVAGVTERITQVLSGSGGEIQKETRWGRRRFAYELDRKTEGFYVILEFGAEPSALRELERVLTLADEVIRFKTLLLPEKAAKQIVAATPEVASEATAEPEAPAEADVEPAPAVAESA